jgi:threonine/homoserine efflux transporter RhtA
MDLPFGPQPRGAACIKPHLGSMVVADFAERIRGNLMCFMVDDPLDQCALCRIGNRHFIIGPIMAVCMEPVTEALLGQGLACLGQIAYELRVFGFALVLACDLAQGLSSSHAGTPERSSRNRWMAVPRRR